VEHRPTPVDRCDTRSDPRSRPAHATRRVRLARDQPSWPAPQRFRSRCNRAARASLRTDGLQRSSKWPGTVAFAGTAWCGWLSQSRGRSGRTASCRTSALPRREAWRVERPHTCSHPAAGAPVSAGPAAARPRRRERVAGRGSVVAQDGAHAISQLPRSLRPRRHRPLLWSL
jgi:hypothetical protein